MLRQALLFLSGRKELEDFFHQNRYARQACSQFIAGTTRSEAIDVAKGLNRKGFGVTLVSLGEEVETPEEAANAAREYLDLLAEATQSGLQADISVKLSHLGLHHNRDLARKNLQEIVQQAAEMDRDVRLDMEGADLVDDVLNLACDVFPESRNLGVTLQSYLRRSSADLDRMNALKIPVRLTRGAYHEKAEDAFQDREEIDLYFMRLVEALFRDGCRPVIATHDEKLIEFAIDMAFIFNRSEKDYQFQLLYGIRPDLQEDLLHQGYNVSIYLPYGEDWYGYFMRRLADRPKHLWQLLRHLRR